MGLSAPTGSSVAPILTYSDFVGGTVTLVVSPVWPRPAKSE